MPKSERILSFFPAFYGAMDRNKLLNFVVRRLAQPLEEIDTHLFRIQRAHRLNVAEHTDDIIRLSVTLGLSAFHFEDIIQDPELSYEIKLKLMRERVQRIAKVHQKGLGTPWAIMEAVATFLNATIVSNQSGDTSIAHLDAASFSHAAIIEFKHALGSPRDRIYLHENPYLRRKVEPAEKWPHNSWALSNQSVSDSAAIKLMVQGIGERTILPSIFCPDTEEGLLFNGIIPEGETLSMDVVQGALIVNESVDEWLIFYRGGVFDYGKFDQTNFVVEEGGVSSYFDGDLSKIVAQPFRKKRNFPTAPLGKSEWYFRVAEGIFDSTHFDYSVFVYPSGSIGNFDGDFNYDQCLFAFPASGVVGMAWDERTPCTFKLLLPAHLPGSESPMSSGQKPVNYLGRISSILSRFKAAGIRAYVDTTTNSWILGESVLRNQDAKEGEGIEFHVTQLRDNDKDLFLSLST